VYPECDGAPDAEAACNAKKSKDAEESKVKAIIFDRLLYRHWNAYKHGMRGHIFVVPAPTLPSGEGWGTPFSLESAFSGTIQMCGVFLFAARSTSTALNKTHLPSGEGTGSPTRFSFIMSSKENGCLA
jgi:hypothetical protein